MTSSPQQERRWHAAEEISAVAPPLPGPAVIRQRWSEASFLHWRIPGAEAAPFMPAGTRPDIIDGTSWIGLIGFRMSDTGFFGSPGIPWLGDFPEINVRLYSVDEQGRRGVVFRSLEASRLLPVLFARAAFGLRYQWASMRIERDAHLAQYGSTRIGAAPVRSRLVTRPGESFVPADGSVELALTARWAFHQRHLGQTLYCRNDHEPWPLQRAELVHLDDGLLAAAGFPQIAQRPPDSVLFSSGVSARFATPQSVAPATRRARA